MNNVAFTCNIYIYTCNCHFCMFKISWGPKCWKKTICNYFVLQTLRQKQIPKDILHLNITLYLKMTRMTRWMGEKLLAKSVDKGMDEICTAVYWKTF